MSDSAVFWADLQEDLQDPEFRRAFVLETMRIAATDDIVNAFDEARERAGITKADLARAIGIEPASIRRLFSTGSPNPTIGTLTDIATALGLRITVEPLPSADRRIIADALTAIPTASTPDVIRLMETRTSVV